MPVDNPVMVVLYKLELVIDTLPPVIFVHVPVPAPGEFPAIVTTLVPEARHWSSPANEAIGPRIAFVVTTTLSVELEQLFTIVHVKVYVVLAANPVTTAFARFLFENVTPVVGETVHVPVSLVVGILPFNINGDVLQIV